MERLRIVIAIVVVLALLGVAWRRAARAFASDEELIRARIEAMVEGFEEGDVGDATAAFADDYRDHESGYGRREIADGLRALFFQGYGSDGVAYRVELPPEEVEVQVEEGGERARTSLHAIFHRRRKSGANQEERVWWDARAILDWRRKGARWELVGSSEVNHSSRGR